MITALLLLYDSTVEPWNADIQAIKTYLEELQASGVVCKLMDTHDMTEANLKHWREGATTVAVRFKQAIRQVFGSHRQGGLPYLGKQVPALFVYEEDPNRPVAVYPHSKKGVPKVQIAGFLKEVLGLVDG